MLMQNRVYYSTRINQIFFKSNIGVRQGENLSSVLFSLFLNDLDEFLIANGNEGIELLNPTDNLEPLLKIIALLYADDTILISDCPIKLQKTLDNFTNY